MVEVSKLLTFQISMLYLNVSWKYIQVSELGLALMLIGKLKYDKSRGGR